MNKKRVLWAILLVSAASVLALLLALEVPGWAATFQSQTTVISPASLDNSAIDSDLFPNCRFGLVPRNAQLEQFDVVSNLAIGWYLNFGTQMAPSSATEAEFAQMIRVYQGAESRGGTDTCGPSYPYTITPALTDTVLGAYIDNNLGALWIIGNEPERVNVQGDICPQQYAEAYYEAYHFIKGRDPTAQVAIAGLVEVTPARLQYLDIVWDAYLEKYGTRMPVDVWTMHVYILSETDDGDAHVALGTDPGLALSFSTNCPDPNTICQAEHDDMGLFMEQVTMMRQWMKDHGEQDKPLIITEYGILKPYNYYGTCSATTCPPPIGNDCFCDENSETFHPERVADYIEATFDYLMTATDPQIGYPADDYRLVQQWLWYSLATEGLEDLAHASNLVYTDTYTLTVPGWQWHGYVADISPEVNLLPTNVPPVSASSPSGTDPVTVALSAAIANNGNIAVTDTVTVTFYSDESLTTVIGTTTFTGLGGCARRQTVVTTTWADLGSGAHPFWVKVDSGEMIVETKETDNVKQGIVIVNPVKRFLPIVQ
ncbi:MAG: hypothetical protein JW918_16030 [Anaerolineae bacterium]|nr:hypothetical protein [Anaerolineae bacterium]